jgi:serine/threonine protein kinase
MFGALRSALDRWFGPTHTDAHATAAEGIIVPDTDVLDANTSGEQDAFHVPYDENLLERARTQWQFGDWETLAAIERNQLQHHPYRGKLALLAAAGLLQTGETRKARTFIQLAQDWGMSKQMVSRILIAGVHNSLGRAAAAAGQDNRALGHFENSVAIGTPDGDLRLLSQARASREMGVLQLSPSPNAVPSLINTASKTTELKEPLLISEGYEAQVYGNGDEFIKVYKPEYFQYNKDYNRRGEGRFLKANQSTFFISLLEENPFYIVMPYAGERIGDMQELDYETFNCEKLCVWVLELKDELKRLGVQHRDINPSNILYHRDRDEFRLIDFGWAIESDELLKESLKPLGMNPYGLSDDEALEKMIASTTQYLSRTADS